MLTTRFSMIVCRAGMYRRTNKHGAGRRMGQSLKASPKSFRAQARREEHHSYKRAMSKADNDRVSVAKARDSRNEGYLCIDDTRAVYEDAEPEWFTKHRAKGPAEQSTGVGADPPSIVIVCYMAHRALIQTLEAYIWEAQVRDTRGLRPIQEWGFQGAPTRAFEKLYKSRLTSALQGIIDFKLEHRRLKLEHRLSRTSLLKFEEAPEEPEAEVNAYVLIPKDDRVKFHIHGGAKARYMGRRFPSPKTSWTWMLDPRGSSELRVGVVIDGREVAIIEEDGVRATEEGHCLRLHRTDEASRLHESRLCNDVFQHIMGFV
jgi:hypothetical protein